MISEAPGQDEDAMPHALQHLDPFFGLQRHPIDVADPSRFGRLTLKNGAADWHPLSSVESEFPTFDPRRAGQRHRFSWTVQGAHGIGHLGRYDHATDAWQRPPQTAPAAPRA